MRRHVPQRCFSPAQHTWRRQQPHARAGVERARAPMNATCKCKCNRLQCRDPGSNRRPSAAELSRLLRPTADARDHNRQAAAPTSGLELSLTSLRAQCGKHCFENSSRRKGAAPPRGTAAAHKRTRGPLPHLRRALFAWRPGRADNRCASEFPARPTPVRITVAKTRWPSGPGVGPLSRWVLPAWVRPQQVSHRYCTDPACATRKELYVGHLPNVSRSERHRCKRGPAQRRAHTGRAQLRSADNSKPVQSTDGSSERATRECSSKGELRCQRAHIRATRRARSKQQQAANPHPAM